MQKVEYNLSRVYEFLDLVRDENPIHESEELSAPFLKGRPGIIMPGMYSFAMAAAYIPKLHNFINIKFKGAISNKDEIEYEDRIINEGKAISISYFNSSKDIVLEVESKRSKPDYFELPVGVSPIQFKITKNNLEEFSELIGDPALINNQYNDDIVIKSYLVSLISGALWNYSQQNQANGNCVYIGQKVEFILTPKKFEEALGEINFLISLKNKKSNGNGSICNLETILIIGNNPILKGKATCAIVQ